MPAGQVVDEMAAIVDLAPTLLEFAEVSVDRKLDGRSLVPLLKGESPDDWRDSLLVEYNTDTVFPRVKNMGYHAVRTSRWKYIRYNDLKGMDELYDLKNDPYEMRNLLSGSETPPILPSLQAELDRLLSE
ncbi:Arylsulfatase [Stratiformator vulcanicus]|uniref:Arylsulfatase n=1 Tax=Stratiformator vulcanicus TaxID=2527980 RepID=A0A517QY05_9PLAN|nr:Arylsulfatase [Stratiformator vulcanicus]